jgi:hypothetical protein
MTKSSCTVINDPRLDYKPDQDRYLGLFLHFNAQVTSFTRVRTLQFLTLLTLPNFVYFYYLALRLKIIMRPFKYAFLLNFYSFNSTFYILTFIEIQLLKLALFGIYIQLNYNTGALIFIPMIQILLLP